MTTILDRPPLTWFYVARRLDRTTRPITSQPRATRPGLSSFQGVAMWRWILDRIVPRRAVTAGYRLPLGGHHAWPR